MAEDPDPFYAPNRKPAPPRQRQPGRHVWTLTKDGGRIDCELRSHGEFGWETQTHRDGEFSTGRMFATFQLAQQWADLEREALERDGWARV